MHLTQNDCKPTRVWQSPQLLFFMRVSFVLTTLICMHLAVLAHAQNTLSIVVKKERLKNVLELIERQSEYRFLYNDNPIIENKIVTLKMREVTLEKVLKQLLQGTGIVYKLNANNLVVLSVAANEEMSELLQLKAITGKVTDESGKPLAGVTVQAKGSAKATTTSDDGSFSITIEEDANILVFSFIGMQTQEVNLAGKTFVEVNMIASDKNLNEIVVTALGIKKSRKALGYSVSELKGDEFTKVRETNLANALSGKIAGVNASSIASGPQGSSRVVIRGNSSISGSNQPLYVVDGIPIDNSNFGNAGEWGGSDGGDGISSINADDIESISVLKGSSAAALYGSRSSAGVILITTKKGSAGKGVAVEINSSYTMDKPLVATLSDYQYEYGQGNLGNKPATATEAIDFGRMSWGAKMDGASVIQWDGQMRPYSPQKDNLKKFYNDGMTLNNSVAISGGTQLANFRFSVADLLGKSPLPNSDLRRNSFTFSGGLNGKNIMFSANLRYVRERVKNRARLSDSPMNPNYPAYIIPTSVDIETLKPGFTAERFETKWQDNPYIQNPYFVSGQDFSKDDKDRFIGTVEAKYNFTKALFARVKTGTDMYSRRTWGIDPIGLLFNPGGNLGVSTSWFSEFNVEGILGYDKQFGNDFHVSAFAGGNMMTRKNNSQSLGGSQFNIPFMYVYSNVKNKGTGGNDMYEKRINSAFGSAEFNYRDFLYLTVTGRNDWFSTLPVSSNNIFYPSASLSYVLSESLRIPDWVSFAKVRAAFAQVGGDTDPYQLNLTYGLNNPYQGMPSASIAQGFVPNSKLKPFTKTENEFGLEARLFNSRLSVDLAFYSNKTTNDILSTTISPASGYGSAVVNVGEIQNKGIELMLSGSVIKKGNLSWDITGVFSYNNNEVVSLAEGLTSLQVGVSRTFNGFVFHEVGKPFSQVKGYTYKKDVKGQTIFGADGKPKRSDEMVSFGTGVAPYALGITNSFSWKNFSASLLVDAKWGNKIYSATNAYAYTYGLHKNTLTGRETGIVGQGVNESGQPNTVKLEAQDYYRYLTDNITEEFVYDASFIKLRQIAIGYNVSPRVLNGTPFKAVNVSLIARNLLLLYSKTDNVDPESNYNITNAQGLEMFGVPQTRGIGVSLNVKF